MGTELALPDFASFKEKVAETIKTALGNLIPDSAWDKLIADEWDKFTKDRVTQDAGGYNRKEIKSGLSVMIQEEMTKQLKGKVEEWGKQWAENFEKPGDQTKLSVLFALRDIAHSTAKEFLSQIGNDIVKSTLSAMGSSFLSCPNCKTLMVRGKNCSKCGSYVS